MDPIKNSIIKERYRLNNESTALMKETSINQKLYQDINALKKKNRPFASPYLWWGAGIGLALGIFIGINSLSFESFCITWIVFFVAGILIWIFSCSSVESFNKSIDDKKATLECRAKEDIKKVYDDADKKTREQIERYDKEVSSYFNKLKNNRDSLDRMVDFACKLFDSSLVDAINKSSNTERFVVLDFNYVVSLANIVYTSSVGSKGMYDFKIQRYRSLDKDTECEALAAALMKLIGGYVLKKYNSSQGQLKYGNNDASVSLHFEMPNKNFVPATVIV
jgi:hypothetical protein